MTSQDQGMEAVEGIIDFQPEVQTQTEELTASDKDEWPEGDAVPLNSK